jgi:hypothetical protein
MHMLTRRSVPALLASLAAAASTSLQADPIADPIFAAIEAVTRAHADLKGACTRHSALQEALRPTAFYQPKVLVGYNTSMDGRDRGTVYPIHVGNEAEIRRWTHGPDREEAIAKLLGKLEADRLRNLDEHKALGLTDAEAEADAAVDRLADAETVVLTMVPTTRAGAVALANCAVAIMEERRDEADVIAAMRTLGAFMARRDEG